MSENHQNEENCIVFVENCVERNDRLRANEGFQKIYEYIFFNVVKITHDLKKTFDRYTKLLNEENRELIKQVIQKKKYYDFSSISTETQAFTEQSEINDDTNSVAYNMSSIHESELEPFRRPIEEEKLVEQKHTFSQLWLLDKIRRLYYNEDIYDLPKMIFDKVNNLHPNEMFEKKFVLSPPTFVNREDNLSNVYLPVFSNTPTLLTPTNEYCLRRQTLPLIFKYYLANDVRLGNVILVRSPNKNQINGGCKIFGFFFEFIGIIPKEPFLGVFLNMKYSVDKQILFGDYPGIEDKSSKINSTQYSSLFQTGIFCNSKDIINYEPEIIETTPYVNEQISFTGIVSTDLVSTIWSNISRDSKESYTIPKVVRMLYCGYFGDFIVTPSIGNSKVKVHKQMKTPINDTSFIILYDHSNTIPYGNISNNIVALLLHYSVPIKTLFDPIPNYISNHLNATLQISNPLHHLISVVDDPNDYYIDTVKKFVRFENIILRHQIPLNHSYHLIGVLDPLNELKKGEVVIGLDNPTVKSFGETILVANNNDLHPFSLQRFNIKNDNYSLKSILGVIVFSLYDAYYYLNSSFDSLKFKLRNSDFVIIGENQKRK
ncbi:RNA-dependent RNA polymerase [Entamoeba marina]